MPPINAGVMESHREAQNQRVFRTLQVAAIIKRRNGTWESWESPHTSKRIFLPLDATAEDITDATLKMLTLSTLRGQTMQEAAETPETGMKPIFSYMIGHLVLGLLRRQACFGPMSSRMLSSRTNIRTDWAREA